MSAVVFEKAIVTYTFLVDMEAHDISRYSQEVKDWFAEAQRDDFPADKLNAAERALLADPADPEELAKFRAQFDDPQFLAEMALQARFTEIIKRLRPYGVRTAHSTQGKPVDDSTEPANVAAVRQQIEIGERSERLVTVGVGITRPPVDQAETGPTMLPFCGFSWLTNQIGDEPGGGLTLLHMTVRQIPA